MQKGLSLCQGGGRAASTKEKDDEGLRCEEIFLGPPFATVHGFLEGRSEVAPGTLHNNPPREVDFFMVQLLPDKIQLQAAGRAPPAHQEGGTSM